MLNNRQAGRRRGRGGQRQQGNGGRGPEQGNRIDNRARGNAPKLLEKYKTLARDAQMAGDRVMTEYYLQFADHYFRVVAESRARFEEQRRQRGDWQDEYEGDDRDDRAEADDQDLDDGDGDQDEAPRQAQDRSAEQGRQRDRADRDRPRGPRDSGDGEAMRGRESGSDARGRRPREDRSDRDARNGYRADRETTPATIDVAVLPPSFGSDGPMSPVADLPMGYEGERDEPEAAPPKRRGRPRKVVAEAAG